MDDSSTGADARPDTGPGPGPGPAGARRAASHTVLAEALRKRIALGGFEPGDRLPTERELAAVFGVGRTTVRQALRLLADEGLVVTTLGRSGGTRVATGAPHGRGARAAAEQAAVAADFRATLRDYMEYRQAIEPVAARLAAERGSTADRRALVGLLRTPVADLGAYHLADSRFHLAVAAAGGNEVLHEAVARARAEMFVGGNALWLRADWHVVYGPGCAPGDGTDAGTGEGAGEGGPAGLDDVFRDEHEAIAHAVLAGDGAEAEARMRAHLEDSYAQFLRLLDHLAGRG